MVENQHKFYENPIGPEKLARLRAAAGDGPVLILTHDNPDPDALASGKALAALLEGAWNIACDLRYSGLVARAENKAMLNLLTPEWQFVETLADVQSRTGDSDFYGKYTAVAMVDTQPTAGNNRLPADLLPDIVLDHHHPIRESLDRVPFADVRPDVGATASLVYQYLDAAKIPLDAVLATAIFYGIQADTRSLSRGDSEADRMVYHRVLDLIDRALLADVEQARLSRDYFRAFAKGLQAARIFGRVAVVYQGEIHRPDFGAELADLLIRLEGLRAVLCLGFHANVMHLSMRTVLSEDDAGLLIQQAVLPPGKAGGHGMGAGGQIPLAGRDPLDIARQVQKRFLQAMGEKDEGEPLLM